MEKRKYTSPQIEIDQVEASEILVIIADSETNTQWAPLHNFDEESFVSEEYDNYGIKSLPDIGNRSKKTDILEIGF